MIELDLIGALVLIAGALSAFGIGILLALWIQAGRVERAWLDGYDERAREDLR